MCRARSSGRAKPWRCCALALGLDPHAYAIDDRLMEISYGEWEGLTLPEIDARMPGMLAEREQDKWDFAPPGGESYRELRSPHRRMVCGADAATPWSPRMAAACAR